MRTITNDFKTELKTMGKEIDAKITYTINGTSYTLGADDLNSVKPHYQSGILKSTMKELEIDSNIDIPLGTIIECQFGVKVNGSFEYMSYGHYIVYSSEKQEDLYSYKITCYDKMLYSMKDYEAFATYPITIRDYLTALCNQIGLTFKNANDYFTNYDKTLDKELYLDENGNSLNYTYRDVLDELAQVTASTICINENDDELEIRYISNAGETTTNVSGTSLSITSEDSQTNKIELLGNTTQNTTTGKSLLNPNRIEKTTSHGITVSYDANTQVITFNGTCDTDNTTFYFTNSYLDVPTATSGLTTMTAYYVSGSITNYLTWRINDSSWSTNKSLDLLDIATSKKKSLTSNATFTLANSSFSFRFNNGSKATNLKLKIMVANNTNTDYEPYTNGISPNPSYPQDIMNVTGRQEVKCVGKNLLNIDGTRTSEGLTNITSGTIISVSGTSSNTYSSLTNQITQNIPIGTYTFSIQETLSKRIGFIATFNDNTSATYYITANQYSTTFTTLKPIISYRLYLETTNGTIYNLTIKPQLENSSIATSFEPYKENINEINLGKNLLNVTSSSITVGSLTITKNSDNSFTLNGTNGSSTYWHRVADNFTLQAGTYTLSNSNSNVGENTAIFYDDNGYFGRTEISTRTFTAERIIKPYIRVSANATFNNFTIYPMIEKGTQATSYSPYFTPIELCKIGTYQDKIFKNSGKNLFDKDTEDYKKGYYLNSSGVETSGTNWGVYYIKVKPNTSYTISGCQTNGGVRFCWFDSNKTFISTIGQKQNRTNITSPSNAGYIGLSIVWNTASSAYDGTTFMLQEGSVATEYEPYGNGEWYKKEVIEKVIFNGSEDWTYQSQYSRFYTYLTNGALQSERANSKSNYYVYGNTETTNNTFFISSANSVLIRNTNITSSADFQTWLSTHNTIVYYVLTTPTYTKLNDTLQEQLNSIRLLEGTNNVMSSVPIDLTYVSGIDTIDEEYFNEDNVNFGEMYGPVNTIILSRSAESDEIAQSIPSNLSDDEKVAIKIKENQIMNFDNRDEFLYGILTRLYGLRYTQNDYSSKGICYYNICDRYKANIFGKDYYCVMLNDDVTIESGLSENVYTEIPETAQTDYSKTSTSDRIERQTTLIVDKQAGIITARVVGIEEEIDGENTYQLTQDERYLASKTYYILQNSQYVVYTNYSVGDIITGDIYEVVNNGILGRIQATEIKQTNQALEISAIDDRFNDDGSVRALSTTNYTFNSNGLKIGKSTDDYNSLQDNTGTYYYEKDTMIGKYTKDGSVQKDFALFGRYYYGIDEHTSVEDFTRDKALFLALLYNDGTEDGIGHFYNGTN